MNALESYIEQWQLDPVKTMNWATDRNLISDECVEPKDVADCDGIHVCAHLNNWPCCRVSLR